MLTLFSPTSNLSLGNPWYFYCIHTFVFSRISYSWDPITSVQLLSRFQLFATRWSAETRFASPSPTPWAYSKLLHWVSDAIQPSHPLSSPSPPTFDLSQHQSLFQWLTSSHEVAKVLEFQLQHQSFQWLFRTSGKDASVLFWQSF